MKQTVTLKYVNPPDTPRGIGRDATLRLLPNCGARSTPVMADQHIALLTKQDAARHLKVSPRYIERMVRAGRLRAYKPTGGLFRVRLCDLEAFVESGASIAPAQANENYTKLKAERGVAR